ncbi:MAG: S41 family peptidase, partial [Candidatus Aminicenantes bacterium]|nr:S41 family peptidase [Candidatus Aminicenantes bacterium]
LRLLRPFVATIRDGHTVLLRSRDDQGLGLMPLSFASIERCLFVDGVPSAKDKALLGAKLLSVEGVPFAEMLKRMPNLLGIENDTHCLMMLNVYLGLTPLLKELFPEWQDSSNLRVQLELADGRTQERSFALRDKNAPPLVRAGSKLEVPSMEKTQFAYRFLSPDRKTALLKIDGLGGYREMWESEGRSRDITKELALVYQQILKREAPTDTAAALAGIPSAVETFRRLFTEMKEAGTEALIIDLSQNRGGNSLMADILTYFLYGTQKLAQIVTEERSVKKYSPYFFEALPGRSIDDINRQNAQVQSYPLTENDYDFAEDRFKELFLAGKIDVATGMALKYADTPTFLAELQSGAYTGYYTPKKVIVTTSHETYSSGFTMLRYLYKSGATVVGSTSAQSGNGFGNGSMFTLKNTGLKMTISKNAYVVFPEAPNERKQIMPHHELTYEKLKSYGFDPQAVVLYALELLKTL